MPSTLSDSDLISGSGRCQGIFRSHLEIRLCRYLFGILRFRRRRTFGGGKDLADSGQEDPWRSWNGCVKGTISWTDLNKSPAF